MGRSVYSRILINIGQGYCVKRPLTRARFVPSPPGRGQGEGLLLSATPSPALRATSPTGRGEDKERTAAIVYPEGQRAKPCSHSRSFFSSAPCWPRPGPRTRKSLCRPSSCPTCRCCKPTNSIVPSTAWSNVPICNGYARCATCGFATCCEPIAPCWKPIRGARLCFATRLSRCHRRKLRSIKRARPDSASAGRVPWRVSM